MASHAALAPLSSRSPLLTSAPGSQAERSRFPTEFAITAHFSLALVILHHLAFPLPYIPLLSQAIFSLRLTRGLNESQIIFAKGRRSNYTRSPDCRDQFPMAILESGPHGPKGCLAQAPPPVSRKFPRGIGKATLQDLEYSAETLTQKATIVCINLVGSASMNFTFTGVILCPRSFDSSEPDGRNKNSVPKAQSALYKSLCVALSQNSLIRFGCKGPADHRDGTTSAPSSAPVPECLTWFFPFS